MTQLPNIQNKFCFGLIYADDKPNDWELGCYEKLREAGVIKNSVWLSLASLSHSDIKESPLDIILAFTELSHVEAANLAANHGIWQFRFGGSLSNKSFGLREVVLNSVTQEVTLEMLSKGANRHSILRRGYFKTHGASLSKHRQSTLAQCTSWPAELAVELAQTNHIQTQGFHDRKKSGAISQILNHALLMAWPACAFYRKGMRLVKSFLRAFTYQQWNIGIIDAPISELLKTNRSFDIHWLPRPKWPLCLADPFPIQYRGQNYVMAEQYDFLTVRGSITALKLNSDLTIDRPLRSLSFPFHVSYPCVVQNQDSLYCVLETLETNDLVIYRCENFPHMWSKFAVVQTGKPYADPTLFQHEGRWWILATSYDQHSEGNSSLYAWHSPTIAGPWTPHLKNPVKIDVASSRSAGTPFSYEGRLYRPSQNCSVAYGGSVVINAIETLTPTEFKENRVVQVRPDSSYPDAFHHVASFGNKTFVDGRRDLFFPLAAFTKFRHWFAHFGPSWLRPISNAIDPASLGWNTPTNTRVLRWEAASADLSTLKVLD